MHLPPLHASSMTHYCTSGDVSIAPDAAIAAGTVLRADVGSAIAIASGACLGLGCVLHAQGGRIEVEPSASLGAGVLVVGNCRIGSQACIGTSTTLHNVNVGPGQLIPPGSLLGAAGRSAAGVGQTTEKRNSPGNSSSGKTATMEPEPSPWDEPEPAHSSPDSGSGSSPDPNPDPNQRRSATGPTATGKVYGREQFERIRGAFS